MKKSSGFSLKRALALVLTGVMLLSLLPGTALAARSDTRDVPVAEIPAENAAAAETAELPEAPAQADLAAVKTYYVSTSGRGGNNGLSAEAPLPGLDAVPWSRLQAGDQVLLKKGDTFPGTIRMVDVHGTERAPIVIGAYGDAADAPVIEARGQGIWLPETDNGMDGDKQKPVNYASSGVLLYGCSYVTVENLHIVNVPDTMRASFQDASGASDVLGRSDHSYEKLKYSGVAVAADGSAAAAGITLRGITVQGDSDVQAAITETSTNVDTTGVTKGAAVGPRTYTNAAGTYYVSSKNGSDSNDGSTPEKAFYSLHKINELNLQPGAKVYLERGSVFENQYIHVNGGGAEGNPVIIDAYGTGDTPVMNTNGNGVWYQNFGRNLDNPNHVRHGYVSSCVLLYDIPYIEVRNIGMTNFGRYGETQGADFDNLGSYDGGTVPGETGYNANGNIIGTYTWGSKMCRTGVSGVAQNKGTVTHTVLRNLDIENIYGNVIHKHMNNGGIYFTVATPQNETATGIAKFDDVVIEGCYLKRTSRWGILVAYTTYHNRFNGAAISDETARNYGMTNLYVGHNYLEEVGGDPITLEYAFKPVAEYNVAYNGGREMSSVSGVACYMNNTHPYYKHTKPDGSLNNANNRGDVSAGIWPWKCKSALFEHNECYTMLYSHLGGNNDAQAWDADFGDSTIYQYNYSSGNTGGCIMFCGGEAYNTVFRYNVSYKDGKPFAESNNRRGILDPSSSPNGQFTNNTFVMAEGTPIYHYTSGAHHTVRNNIFFNLGNEYAPEGGWNAASGLAFTKNIYVGFAQTGAGSYTGKDTNPITLNKTDLFADPTFVGAPERPKTTEKSGVRTVNGVRDWTHDWTSEFNMFKIADAKKVNVANQGLPHDYDGLEQDNNFGVLHWENTTDFFGNPLDTIHDIGAHETGATDPEGVTVTSVDHESATAQWTPVTGAASYKVALDGGEPVAAAGASYHSFTGLFPLAEYTVSVTAYDASGNPVGAARTATFTTTRPAAPANPNSIQPVAVKAGNAQSGNEAAKAIDGNDGTIWHTTWGGNGASTAAAEDKWIAIDLGSVRTVKNFKYRPRQDGSGDGASNGNITQYEIYISSTESAWNNATDASWTKVKEGNWENNKAWKTVAFDANTTARYVKLKCVTGHGGFVSAAEIAVDGAPCTGITLADATVAVNKTVTLSVTPTPADASTSYLVWTSGDRSVATVDQNGAVTGLKEGTTTIAAYLPDAETPSATCTVTVIPRELSSACALVTSLFEVRDTDKLQVPYTENNPTTVAELKAGLTVSEAATVQVLNGAAEQADTANVAAGMTVRIVAENGTSHTDYTVAQKNEYNNYNDWVTVNSKHQHGNVWFAQYRKADGFHDWEANRWDTGGWYADTGNGYASSERNGACDDIRAESSKTYLGSGFTFRAPVDGMVEVSFPTQPVFKNAGCASNSYTTYLVVYKNDVAGNKWALPKNTAQNANIPSFTVSMAQGDTFSFMITNEGSSGTDGNGGVQFTPAITYKDEVYVPAPETITLNESEVTLSTNDPAAKTVQLTATVLPEEADRTVTWSIREGDEAVISVSNTGLVTAVGNGTAVVYARVDQSWGAPLQASCSVTVSTKITGITVQKDGVALTGPVKLYVNDDSDHVKAVTLTAVVEPDNASNKVLNWTRPEGARGMISVARTDSGAGATITAIGDELDVGEVTVEVASAADPEIKVSFTVQVFRALMHDIHVTGETKVGSTLTASTVDLVMKDAAKEKLKYQWYRGAVEEANKIVGATEKQYVVTENDIGAILSVTVTADPTTFYEGSRTAAASQTVARMAGPAAPEGLTAVKCTDGSTGGKLTGLDATKLYEYSTDGTSWTSIPANSTEITLPAGTYQVRMAGTTTREPGATVTKTILPADAVGYEIAFDVAEGGAISVDKNPAVATDPITITLTPETGYEPVADSLRVTYTDGEGESRTVSVTNNTFTMPAANVTISARFRKKTFTITHAMENVTCSLAGEHTHTVEYGDQPVIILTAKEGYTMPANVTVTDTDTTTTYYGYTYSRKAATPDTATLTFTQGIAENLTISGTVPVKTYAVNYTLKHGLTAPEANAARTVAHKAAYTGTLVADMPTQYQLPLGVKITMGGAVFTDFTYHEGVITIDQGKITGDLVITAEGLDAAVPVKPVHGVSLDKSSATVQVNKTVTLTAVMDPVDATEQGVTWSTSNAAIATVDENGVVTGVSEGVAVIMVTTTDGGLTAQCVISVTKATTSSGSSTSSSGSTPPVKGDDVKVTTETKPDGTKVVTTESPDGTKAVVETKPDGSKTQTVEQPDGTKSEMNVTKEGDVTITVTDAEGEELVKTEIPAEIPEPETKFEDVAETAPWAEEAINKVAGLELVKGTGGNKYSPVAPMTRGSLATVLHRLSQGKTDYANTFKDVAQGKYYTEGVAWAAKANVVKGVSEDIFAPEETITREQLAVMLARYAKLVGLNTKADPRRLQAFSDSEKTGTWAVDGMAWCVENGILKGKSGNALDPNADVTRAEVAVMLDRFIALLK